MSALLASRLYKNDCDISQDYVREIVEEGIKKIDFITFIIEFVSKYALTNNVWLLSKIKSYFGAIEIIKQSDKRHITQQYYELLNLIKQIPKQKYVFCSETDKTTLSSADMNVVTYDVDYTVVENDLALLSGVVNADVYKLLLFMFSCITQTNNLSREENLRKCFSVIRYLLTLQPKSYLQMKGCKMDIVDILFVILILFSNSTYCTVLVRRYVNISKDIFYHRITKSKKLERINFIFYIVYVIIFGDIVDKEVYYNNYIDVDTVVSDEECAIQDTVSNNVLDVNEKCKYLYFYSEYDESLALQVKFEKERNKLKTTYKPSFREIDVAWTINNEKDYICVLKQDAAKTF